MIKSSRRGTVNWRPAPFNSRLNHRIDELANKGFYPCKVTGKKGTMISFVNNAAHRVNPLIEGYRDVLNIRVKPTIKKISSYVSPSHTTSYETKGVVNRNPEII